MGRLVTLAIVVVLVLLSCVLVFPRLLHPPLSAAELRGVASADKRVELQQTQAKLQNDARATLLQGVAGLLLVAGAVATWRQLGISREQLEVVRQQALESDRQAREQLAVIREGQITDRFTRAVEQLGSDKLEVRLGGIFALERIAKDSEPDRWAITDTLVAFVVPTPHGVPAHPRVRILTQRRRLMSACRGLPNGRLMCRKLCSFSVAAPQHGNDDSFSCPVSTCAAAGSGGLGWPTRLCGTRTLPKRGWSRRTLRTATLCAPIFVASLRRVRTSAGRACARPILARRTFSVLPFGRRTCVMPICAGRTCVMLTCVELTCAARAWREQR